MRISDWSSDVCSSDLQSGANGGGHFPPDNDPIYFKRVEQSHRVTGSVDRLRRFHPTLICSRPSRRRRYSSDWCRHWSRRRRRIAPPGQIGRASWRERVGQYVSISVVGVSVKKKTKQK